MNFYTRQNNVNPQTAAMGAFDDDDDFENDLENDSDDNEENSSDFDWFDNRRKRFPKPHFCPSHDCCRPKHDCCRPKHDCCCPRHDCCRPHHDCCSSWDDCCSWHDCCPPHKCECFCEPFIDKCKPVRKKKRRQNGAIIPFASGNTPVIITTLASTTETTGFVSAIGFGETQNGSTIGTGGELSLSAGNMAFSVPRNGTITAISAFFTNTAAVTLGASVVQVSAQLYFATPNSNVFLPLGGTRVNLTPTLTGTVPANSVFSATVKNLNVDVARGTRLVLVFFASVISGPSINATLTGTASAGVNII
ncbi:MAG: hypothetical protein A2Y15_05615 [Clostridiales bacterium GWF2_36_10]|nr:MAG: hypothetical protein A2Y15_05615 [Clostridiales bacterium GWF2_36_10]HAN21979.1 hypothetical protein [Clostridiales bacterium]